jgi:hypothetical protein
MEGMGIISSLIKSSLHSQDARLLCLLQVRLADMAPSRQELRGTPKIVMSAFGGPDSAAITRPHSSKFLLVKGTFAALRVLLHYDYNPLVVLVNLLYT